MPGSSFYLHHKASKNVTCLCPERGQALVILFVSFSLQEYKKSSEQNNPSKKCDKVGLTVHYSLTVPDLKSLYIECI